VTAYRSPVCRSLCVRLGATVTRLFLALRPTAFVAYYTETTPSSRFPDPTIKETRFRQSLIPGIAALRVYLYKEPNFCKEPFPWGERGIRHIVLKQVTKFCRSPDYTPPSRSFLRGRFIEASLPLPGVSHVLLPLDFSTRLRSYPWSFSPLLLELLVQKV